MEEADAMMKLVSTAEMDRGPVHVRLRRPGASLGGCSTGYLGCLT